MTEEEKKLEFCMPILAKRVGSIGHELLIPEQAKEYDFIPCERKCCHKPCWVAKEADQSSFQCDGIMDL
ncbi:MAG: hypothetical protein WC123_07290 [Bacilli bacterium]